MLVLPRSLPAALPHGGVGTLAEGVPQVPDMNLSALADIDLPVNEPTYSCASEVSAHNRRSSTESSSRERAIYSGFIVSG